MSGFMQSKWIPTEDFKITVSDESLEKHDTIKFTSAFVKDLKKLDNGKIELLINNADISYFGDYDTGCLRSILDKIKGYLTVDEYRFLLDLFKWSDELNKDTSSVKRYNVGTGGWLTIK